MPIEVHVVENESDFAEVVKVEHEAYSKPLNGFWDVLKGPNEAECTKRQWAWHKGEKEAYWLKATDASTGKVIGAAQWVVHKENPFKQQSPPFRATWWPENSTIKIMSDLTMDEFFSHRPARMNRPHLLIGYCFVHSEERRRGAGSTLMEWGCKIADDLGLEAFVESTETGRPLYEAAGFVVVDCFYLDPQIENPSTEWTNLKQEIFPEPFRVWFMWRPKGGKFEEGKTKFSWEED